MEDMINEMFEVKQAKDLRKYDRIGNQAICFHCSKEITDDEKAIVAYTYEDKEVWCTECALVFAQKIMDKFVK